MATGRACVRVATKADVDFLQGKLREEDRLEIEASCGRDPDETLAHSFSRSSKVWTGFFDGLPFVMFGIAAPSIFSIRGAPWLLGTDLIESVGHAFGVRSRYYVNEMRKGYRLLENYTDDRHKSAHRWLRWCGFKMADPAPWGVQGLPFRRFWMDGFLK